MSEYFNVFKVRFGPALADPDVAGPRYHTVIFVETGLDGTGYIHQVIGDLVTGMRYDKKPTDRPERSDTFFDKTLLGRVARSNYPAEVDRVCQAQPAPPRQKAFNRQTMKTEPIKSNGSFYGPGDSRPRLIKCTEWTENQAIPALRRNGLLL
ncbi:hypothetical protein ABEF92_006999 [Exophiala dermatitidis]|uniref:Uncharacterized protein n=1 Tax=Exophiala dermatitidis (strain ATCC 34100 / CBS 525.76 / NIH/UT8656) TaxID=858893 RepID=H6C9M4_EXODN|nr:uncharacterized protein HMPREF1120_08687 [Exophiala dermatitidis NIH/UT8656]EHY60742.1 hypothetical protein HMPREF1120_08687 [Exophiala dermatitidis NIH/UT8656]